MGHEGALEDRGSVAPSTWVRGGSPAIWVWEGHQYRHAGTGYACRLVLDVNHAIGGWVGECRLKVGCVYSVDVVGPATGQGLQGHRSG